VLPASAANLRAFAASGAGVFVCDIDSDALETTAKEIPDLIVRPCDMARRAEIERLLPEAVARLGGLDVRDCQDKPGNDG
jgi:NAD(P)-dependent dehydrogenase (short-subunit alcohol dehydrogenase family)